MAAVHGAPVVADQEFPRVVSLLPGATEMLLALGVMPLAVSHECDYPAEVSALPRVTRSRIDSTQPSEAIDGQVRQLLTSGTPLYELDEEAIASLAPGWIVTQSQCDVCAVRHADIVELVARRPELQNTDVVPLNPMSLADVLDDLLRLGKALGRERAAEQAIARLVARRDRIAQQVALPSAAPKPRMLVIEWCDPLMAAGNWTPELVSLAGALSLFAQAGQHSGYVTWEEIRTADPEVMVIAPCGFDLMRSLDEAERLKGLAGWRQLAAVKSRRVFAIDGNQYLNRPGPRLIDTLEILAHLAHPECFPPPALAMAFRRVP